MIDYSDLCGKLLQNETSHYDGHHGSKLALDFRSNRIYHKGDFNLGIVCIPSSAMAQKNSGYGNGYSVQDCSSSQTLRSKRSANRPITTKEFFVRYIFLIKCIFSPIVYLYSSQKGCSSY